LFEILGMTRAPKERDLYREVSIIGELFPFFMDRYQQKIKEHNLIDVCQIIDFSSSYLEGNMSDLASFGYSRDHRPGKKQVTFGIATGINSVPTALTIQKGNTNDKTHMRKMLSIAPKITTEGSLLIFDCGGNSPKVKDMIIDMKRNYLTLKAKKVSTYKKYILEFNIAEKQTIRVGEKEYLCTKFASYRKGEFLYMFFSKDLCEDQLRKKRDKFERMKKKGDKLLKKVKK
ncbi:transposase IS4 family protein, partial [mine drainage metagenome]